MASFRQALSKNQKKRSKLQRENSAPEPLSPEAAKKKKSKISGQPHKFDRGER
jgi:hypothetical protein